MEKPLDLLVSNVMGPFGDDLKSFLYLLTVTDNVSTFRIVYPLKSRSDTPGTILDAITHLTVQLKVAPKALQTDNAREFTSSPSLELVFIPPSPIPLKKMGKPGTSIAPWETLQEPHATCAIVAPSSPIRLPTINHNYVPVWSGSYHACPSHPAEA
ncbi:hypothetical protein O181_002577 [Austropuccinia psidii MF-1]|uniref:Integrase catalytic domain-containing protein n=1 Tax=Austropuccinia psidii MF-1 TaxID=1389203 RepID=A0A9Q3BCQ9_9BASI|nr:hypothetical protein [Austropuccinia psidii MF-1]